LNSRHPAFSEREVGRNLVVWAGLLAVAVAISSCSEFTVRESEEPTGVSTGYVVPREPGDVISNLVNAVQARDVVNYGDLFSDDFTFSPDPRDSFDIENVYPGAFADWGVQVERTVANQILDESRNKLTLLTFIDGTDEVITDTDSTFVLKQDYDLILLFDGSLRTYSGTVLFSMKKKVSDGLWYMRWWQDFRPEVVVEGRDTWGYLKGFIRGTT
jgi:hypothetical protein